MRHSHLSDRDLVMTIDGELSIRRRAAVAAHLSDCASCKRRRAQLDTGSNLAAAICESAPPGAAQIAASRLALRARMSDLAEAQSRSLLDRWLSPFAPVSRWAMAGVAAVAVVLLVRVAQQSDLRPVGGNPAAVESDALPVASLTPGATWNLTANEVCAPAGREQRDVPHEIRMQVVRAYGMDRMDPDQYELDYLITPELGGAPAAQNLWPQRYASRTWNAHVKDQLERLLPRLVCDGTITLQAAQRDLAVDWVAAYKKHFHTDVPLAAHASLDASVFATEREDAITYPVWRGGNSAPLRLIAFTASR